MGHKYVWQKAGWPNLTWDGNRLIEDLGRARKLQGRILNHAHLIGLESQARLLVEEAITTSSIEGEKLNLDSVRSSVARRLGLSTSGLPSRERHVDGLVEMLFDATARHAKPLTEKRLCGWQAALFPTGFSGLNKITVGSWRTGKEPMQVISEKRGRVTVHFEAPPSSRVADEMKIFLEWWEGPSKKLDGILRAGIAHFWFVTIHPFEDGNGRIARAIMDMALAQDEQVDQRLYSLSAQIVAVRDEYYDVLESCQKKNSDVTEWLSWFLQTFCRAVERSEAAVGKAITLAQFWHENDPEGFNSRQKKVINRLLEMEPGGFVGGMTNRKYVGLTKVSRETAKRDLADLEERGILKRNKGKGRSVSYSVAWKGRK